MSQKVGFFLETERTKAVNDLDIAVDSEYDDPAIQIDPGVPSAEIGGGKDQTGGEINVGNDPTGAILSAKDGFGNLELRANTTPEESKITPGPTVRLTTRNSADSRVQVFSKGNLTTELGDNSRGGYFKVSDATGKNLLVRGDVAPEVDGLTGGRLTVYDWNENAVSRLSGRESALFLTEEVRSEEDLKTANDLVLQSRTVGGGDGSDVKVHVHGNRTRERVGGYTVGSPPRIDLDGATGTLTLGRGRLDAQRQGVAGAVNVFHNSGLQLLELGVTDSGGGKIVFKGGNASDPSASQLARIAADPEGLAIYDDDEKVLVVKHRGEIETTGEITEL